MLIRSLTLAVLLAVAGPLLAADNDTPLASERGKSRPLIVIAPSSIDPTLVSLKEAAKTPAFKERNLVLYTVSNLMGQRDGKDLDAQTTMALIRELKLPVSDQTKVILVGKDGEKKLDHLGPIEAKVIYDAVDQLPAAEKDAAPPAVPVVEAAPAKGSKAAKAGKASKPAEPAQQPDD